MVWDVALACLVRAQVDVALCILYSPIALPGYRKSADIAAAKPDRTHLDNTATLWDGYELQSTQVSAVVCTVDACPIIAPRRRWLAVSFPGLHGQTSSELWWLHWPA